MNGKRKAFRNFFGGQLMELFHRTMKKIKNPAKYELLLPKPLTLTLWSLMALKRLINSFLWKIRYFDHLSNFSIYKFFLFFFHFLFQLMEMRLTVSGLEKERDFYFGKLREIEVLCQDEGENSPLIQKILDILYATEVSVPFSLFVGQLPHDLLSRLFSLCHRLR